MWFKSLNILATALLATTISYGEVAQQAPAPGETPKAPQAAPAPHVKKHVRVSVPAQAGSYLGVDPRDVTPDRTGVLKLNESRGVEAMMVDRDSPAGKAGLQEHDVILGFNGKSVANVDQLRHMLRATAPGTTVPLAISRAGQSMTLNVTLVRRPQEMAGMPMIPAMPPIDIDVPTIMILQSSSRNGAMVEDLTPQLADFFGVKNGGGVLVRSVDHGSAADAAGLKAGDIIVKVGNESISCSSDWRRLMHEQHGNVNLGVVRDKREQGLTLKLPDKGPGSSLRFDAPEFRDQMEQLRAELERQRPEIAKQMQLAQSDLQKELTAHHKEFEQMMQQLRSQEFQGDMQKARKTLEDALKQMQME